MHGMKTVLRRLQAHVERSAAPPALRLLDALLGIMLSDSGANDAARHAAAVDRMEHAFNGGVPIGLDVMKIAKEIEATGATEVDKDIVEFVPRGAFVAELERILDGADERAAFLAAQLKQKAVRSYIPPHLYGVQCV